MTGFLPSGEITRRTLLLAGAGAAATAAIPDLAAAATQRFGRPNHIDRSTWETLVGTVIEVRNPGLPPVPLTLMRVGDLPGVSKQTDPFRERTFVLVFSGPAGQPLAGGVHVLRVPRVGDIPIWFADADLGELGWTYVAVFANSKRRQGRMRKPHAKSARRQARERGEKESSRAEMKPRRKRRRRKREAEAAPKAAAPERAAPAPKPAEPAPKPSDAAPSESFE